MPIDFQAVDNAETYSGRAIDAGWSAAMRTIVDPIRDLPAQGGIAERDRWTLWTAAKHD